MNIDIVKTNINVVEIDSEQQNDDKTLNTVKLAYLDSCGVHYQYTSSASQLGVMGTKNSKAAGDGVETDVDKENDDLMEAVESLPKVETLKSVKKPKGPKGRKPPSRTFLQTIVSYFQVKPETLAWKFSSTMDLSQGGSRTMS